MAKNKLTIPSPKMMAMAIQRHLNWVIYGVIVIVALWTAYSVYQNVVTVAIVPAAIDPSDIVARRQKVDVDLFNSVIQKHDAKLAAPALLPVTPNPFE
ncbi:MAG: hypothetical protein ACOYUK_02560 [Patescibacteria group bacterium]|jgi:hypothetical protein